ncbi:MAG: hypothetical protein WC238_01520 [Parcubacteria group bacterium]|jgi:hypothetical protein
MFNEARPSFPQPLRANGSPEIKNGEKENNSVEFEEKSNQRINKKNYKSTDFEREWEEHPEWHGLSTHEIQKKEEIKDVGGLFYRELLSFAKKESGGDEKKRKEIIERFFPSRYVERKSYRLSDYVKEWNQHPEWHEISINQIRTDNKNIENGGKSFYVALASFAKGKSGGDEKRRKEIIEHFFPPRYVERKEYTFNDYIKEWNQHPEWHGISTHKITKDKKIIKDGGRSFYNALFDFAERESGGDEKRRKEIIEHFFPPKLIYRKDYIFDDYKLEWDQHPEWHNVSINRIFRDKEYIENGANSFYIAFKSFVKKESGDDETKYHKMMKMLFPEKIESIYFNKGLALQYSIENILKIANNKNLYIEKNFNRRKPDLFFEGDKKALIIDVKLQTISGNIEKDRRNYSKIISKEYPQGGEVIFLCLNGPKIENEEVEFEDNKVKIRYYHILDFLERLTDNTRNKFLMRLIAGDENEDISQIKDLSEEQISKINEIRDGLRVLQELVSEDLYSTKDEPLEEAEKRVKEIKNKLRKLAKSKESNQAEIMQTDFKKLLDF